MGEDTQDTPTYREAMQELDGILAEIEEESEVDIDELAGKAERAAQLIQVLDERLRSAEIRIRNVTEELTRDETDSNTPEP